MAKKQLSESTLTVALSAVEDIITAKLPVATSGGSRALEDDSERLEELAPLFRARDEITEAIGGDKPAKKPRASSGGRKRGLPSEERTEA